MLAPRRIVVLEQCSLKETKRPAKALQRRIRLECFSRNMLAAWRWIQSVSPAASLVSADSISEVGITQG